LPALVLSFFDDADATLYLLSPADGTVAAQAIVLMDKLINRQRTKVAQWEEFSRIGLFLDEITNTPIPRLPQYLAESRGLGCAICCAAQSGSQLDAVYGPLQGKAIRDVTPAALIMYGSHERDVMESAAFWSGKGPTSPFSPARSTRWKNASPYGCGRRPARC
jgi:type IV secretory pathway TraG/TraD family ATPase VirD4